MSLTKVSYSMIEGTPANVLDFGAVGDGVTNDTAAIQAALDASDIVYFPDGVYLITQLNINRFAQTIFADAGGGIYGGSGVSLKTNATSGNMLVVTKPIFKATNIVFIGPSDPIEKGSDITTTGVDMEGDVQKDLDATFTNCGFFALNTGVKANGTNVVFESSEFSNCTYGFMSRTGAWENRGFWFKNCKFHSMGKNGTTSFCVYIDPTHNVQDVIITGSTYADDSITLFYGFASLLQIIGVAMPRSRGTAIILDSAGHTQAATRRNAMISSLNYFAFEDINTSLANSAITATGQMALVIDNILVGGCGGHGIVSDVASATIKNVTVNDAGQFANNTYSGIIVSGSSPATLNNITVLQDARGVAMTNKARYGVSYSTNCFSTSVYASGPFASSDIFKAPGVSILTSDIEEGVWTAAIVGATTPGVYEIATNDCRYTKTGRTVNISCRLVMAGSITGGGVGQAKITGLPFAYPAQSTSFAGVIGNAFLTGITYTGQVPYVNRAETTSDTTLVLNVQDNSGPDFAIPVANIVANSVIRFTLTYTV